MTGALAVLIGAASVLVALHGPNGHEILINPDAVTSMHSAIPGQKNRQFTDEVRCMINTSDGKFLSVVETCERVRELLKQSGVNP